MVRFRVAGPSDSAALGQVHVAVWKETYRDLLPPNLVTAQTVASRVAMWRQVLSDPSEYADALVHVAELNGEIMGFGACCLQRTADLARLGFDAEISAIYVRHSHQGRHIGTTLMKRMALALTRRSHRAMSLWVLRENAVARRFYQGLGGREIGHSDKPLSGATLSEIAYGWSDLHGLAEELSSQVW